MINLQIKYYFIEINKPSKIKFRGKKVHMINLKIQIFKLLKESISVFHIMKSFFKL